MTEKKYQGRFCIHCCGEMIGSTMPVPLPISVFPDFAKFRNLEVKVMWKHNDGVDESDILQNEFTAYVVTSVHRYRQRYLRGKKLRKHIMDLYDPLEDAPEIQCEPDMLDGLPVLARIEDARLQSALRQMRTRDLYILFAKVLGERSFPEIAAELGMKYKTVAGIYYRMIVKLKNELRGGDQR